MSDGPARKAFGVYFSCRRRIRCANIALQEMITKIGIKPTGHLPQKPSQQKSKPAKALRMPAKTTQSKMSPQVTFLSVSSGFCIPSFGRVSLSNHRKGSNLKNI
jgi:hypothetical protein